MNRYISKSYTTNKIAINRQYTERGQLQCQLLLVDKVLPTKPVTYSIVDLMGEAIKGSFYEQELKKAKQQTFRIEKVVRRDNKKKLALVKWSAYPDKFNSQVSFKDLVDF